MNYKISCFKIITAIAFGTLLAGSATADTIPGTFYGADASNTTAQGGGTFSSSSNLAGTWFDRSGNTGSFDNALTLSGGNTASSSSGTGGYQASVGDTDIVTTITGLNNGDVYAVTYIFSGVFGNTLFPLSPGLSPTSTSQVFGGGSFQFSDILDETSSTSSLRVVSQSLGTATVANGEISVYTNLVPDGPDSYYGANHAYNGVALELISSAAVPEPSSFAILAGLGGLVFSRRRRR